jgi:hypothetical protein
MSIFLNGGDIVLEFVTDNKYYFTGNIFRSARLTPGGLFVQRGN